LPVLQEAIAHMGKGDIFSEFFLMGIATIGAFAIGEYPEGVAVMVFYSVGEVFQTMPVSSAKSNIKSLLDQRPDAVTVLKNNEAQTVKAEAVGIGEIIQLKPGEKLGHFGGIGAASSNGTLFKGGNFLDALAAIQNVVLGMTYTLTAGVFKVQEVVFDPAFNWVEILQLVNVLESHSSHPVATAIHEYVGKPSPEIRLEHTEEIAGHGLKSTVNGKDLLVGNFQLMNRFGIPYDVDPNSCKDTTDEVLSWKMT